MTSEIRTNSLKSRAGLSTVTLTDSGPIFSGITTFLDNSIFNVGNINATGIITATSFKLPDGSSVGGVESDAQFNTVGGTNSGDSFSGTDAIRNTLYGYDTGTAITSADRTTAVGYHALKTVSTNNFNSAFGDSSLRQTTGQRNNAFGNSAGVEVTSGTDNCFFGSESGAYCGSSARNTGVGNDSLYRVGLGGEGNYNTGVGYKALYDVRAGDNNTSLGYQSGDNINGSNNIVIGANADASSSSVSNEITLGDSNITKFRIPGLNFINDSGNIGQGTATPTTPNGSNADNPLNGTPVFTMYGDSPAINLVSSTTTSSDYSLINFGRTGSSTNPYRAVIGYKQSDDILRISAQSSIAFDTGGDINTNERLRITSTGNLLVGATAVEDWDGSRSHKIQVRGDSSNNAGMSVLITANDDNPSELVLGKSRSTGNTIVGSADDVGQVRWSANDGAGFHSIAYIRCTMDGTPGSNDLPSNLRFGTCADGGTTVTERMRLSSAGDLLLHTTSLNNSAVAGQALQINGTTRPTLILRGNADGNQKGEIQFADNSGSDDQNTGIRAGLIQYDHSNNNMNFRVAGTYTGLKISGTNGRLERNFTGGSGTDDDGMWFNNGGTTSGTFIRFWQTSGGYGANVVGSISHTANNTSYNTSSDYRLKENAVAISDGISRLKSLKPYRFNFKTEPSKTVDGFFAHEAATVVPEAVTGTKDDVADSDSLDIGQKAGDPIHQGMDYGKITPLLTAALQEAITKIEKLEEDNIALRARVTNLEGN